MAWKIRCEVWGGVTGHRVAMLKKEGVEQVFETREAAQKEADALMAARGMLRTAGMQIGSGAQFSYRPVEVAPGFDEGFMRNPNIR